jgi:Flp pilus assembly protein TadG
VIRSDVGSAVVESVLVMVLLMTLVAGVLQLGLVLHVRNTATAAASEGARVAARAGQPDGSGAERTRSVLARTVPGADDATVSEQRLARSGMEIVVVEVRAPLPLVGPWGPSRGLVVRGQALAEPQ